MPGINITVAGCATSRRKRGIVIWKVPAPKNERHKEWRQKWLNEVRKTRSLCAEFKKIIQSKKTEYTCDEDFDPKDIEICK